MTKKSSGMFSPVAKTVEEISRCLFLPLWHSCANATVNEISETVQVKAYTKTLQKHMKLGWYFPDLFRPLCSDISVNTNAGVGAGRERTAVPERRCKRHRSRENRRHAREKCIRLFFDMAILFQIPK